MRQHVQKLSAGHSGEHVLPDLRSHWLSLLAMCSFTTQMESHVATKTPVQKSFVRFRMIIKREKYADIGYNFLVGGDGQIYEGRGWKAVGAHTQGYNSKSLGISFMGNFDKIEPSASMLNAMKNLIDCGMQKKFISATLQIHGHRDAKCTICPGTALYGIIKQWTGFKGGKLLGYVC
ncbi:peptidoglycan-recognition protein SB1 [Trichonephila inaurata madagascariensis]|uniref:Peptidoglycan-recognition protein SB1 n=1 Tax=Trichonephila inaurata madagascariensis TaxID=2747483 RepID=A0A8X6YLQ7_9ARAC|nr:peptidoglycan-recognition protein SB1 [Trichonephila inaurata madagascariensis]